MPIARHLSLITLDGVKDLIARGVEFTCRYELVGGTGDGKPLFVWLQRHDGNLDWNTVSDKASAAALVAKTSDVVGVMAAVSTDGTYHEAQPFTVRIPTRRTDENAHIYDDAFRMANPKRAVNLSQPKSPRSSMKPKKIGRNEPCPCGSGVKYKKCHGDLSQTSR